MNSNKLRKNICIKLDKKDTKPTNYSRYKFLVSVDDLEDISKTHNIEDIDISFAFRNYTHETNVDIYTNSYRPDSPETFKIDPDLSLVSLEKFYISNDPPTNISSWSDINLTIIVDKKGSLSDNISIIPYIDGVSVSDESKTVILT